MESLQLRDDWPCLVSTELRANAVSPYGGNMMVGAQTEPLRSVRLKSNPQNLDSRLRGNDG